MLTVGACADARGWSAAPAGCLAGWLAVALRGPRRMCLCVIMSPSSGHFRISPFSTEQPPLGAVTLGLAGERGRMSRGAGLALPCRENGLGRGEGRAAGERRRSCTPALSRPSVRKAPGVEKDCL